MVVYTFRSTGTAGSPRQLSCASTRFCRIHPSTQLANAQRKHHPRKSMNDQVDSHIETEEPKTGLRPTSQQSGTQCKRDESTNRGPSPIRELHNERRNRAV